jgi:hypothetical protein
MCLVQGGLGEQVPICTVAAHYFMYSDPNSYYDSIDAVCYK